MRRCPGSAAIVALALVMGASAGCSRAAAPGRPTPCLTSQGPTDALCGTLTVYENRAAATGRQIGLNIVVLPALGNSPRPDPLFFLAGGPGQAAAELAPFIRATFRQVQRARDIVLVDQRGTGRSHPLDCPSTANTLAEIVEPDHVALARLRACLEGYDADVRMYTTSIAMDDLDEVRAHLGYARVNLYGGSYGTRAALVYLRQHGARVRSVVLDGVAPPDMRLPLFSARDAQRALDRLLADCETDTRCAPAHRDLAPRVRALMHRLDTAPPRVRLVHPRTGVGEEVTIETRVIANIIFGALYSPVTASLLPELIARAERDDFQGLFALALAGDAGDTISVGMQLSVLCSEDAPRVTAADLARETSLSLFGPYLLRGQLKACAIWPKGAVEDAYYQPVVSEVPTLILSGDLDPVTPPTWGDAVARHLSRARHVVVASTGHGVIGTPCGARLIQQFLDQGSAADLDVSCATMPRRPPFFLSPAGPDPTATSGP